MLRHRRALLAGSVIIVAGSLSATVGYGLHLRGSGYRRGLEQRLSARLGMPLTIRRVRPLSLRSRRLDDLRLHSPRRDIDVFGCSRAVWRNIPADDKPTHSPTYSLDLERGWLIVGSNRWDLDDYKDLLQSGLGHDFASIGLSDVRLTDIDVQWRHPRVTLTADRASGQVRFDDDGTGRAVLSATRLNGYGVDTPIRIAAHFTPGRKLVIHDALLTIPEAPLSALRLDDLVGGPVSRGRFSGSVRYRRRQDGPVVTVRGKIHDALLGELTDPLPGGPYDGNIEIVVDEAEFDASPGGMLRTLRFSGSLERLLLGQWVPALDPRKEARLNLRVHQAVYREGRIDYFSGEGDAENVSLDALTGWIGQGGMTGTLDATIHSLLIVDDQLVLADVTLDAVPPRGENGAIDRAALRTLSKEALGFDATAMLPESITEVRYVRCGARLELNRGELRVRGTHGPDGKTILTVSIWDREIGVLNEPDETYRIDDLIGRMRSRINADALRKWLGQVERADASGD